MKTIVVEDSSCWKSIIRDELEDSVQKIVLRPQDTFDTESIYKKIRSVIDPLDFCFDQYYVFGSFEIQRMIVDTEKYNLNFRQNFRCSNYYHYFQNKLLNFEHSLVPIRMLKELKWHLFKTYSVNTKIFIRPDVGDKSFTGGLFDLQDFDSEIDKILKHQNEDLVLVSSPKEILAEFRFFIKDNQIVDYSLYKYQDNFTTAHSAPEDLKKFVSESIKSVDSKVYSLYVLDVAIMRDQSYKLIEMNGYFTSDLYDCSGKKIIDVLV